MCRQNPVPIRAHRDNEDTVYMPTLNWIGKEAVINHHDEVPIHTLTHDPDRSLGAENESLGTGNLLIEGDNLLALKALLPYYAGKVKCIFIDPPYNTGNENWVYNDNVNNPIIQKWLGKTVGKLAEDLSRHDKWLCMMYPRLCLLHQLLRDDGAIFITIDDNEVHHLRILMSEGTTLENNDEQQYEFNIGDINRGTGGTFSYYHVGETFLEKQEIPFSEMAQLLFFKETGTPMSVDIALSLVEGDRPAYSSCTTDEKRQRAFLGSADGVGVYLLNSDDVLTEDLIKRLPRHDGMKIIHCGGTQLTEATLKHLGITFRQMPYNLV